MPNYRRRHTGSCVFLTLVTADRRAIFADGPVRKLLRKAIEDTRATRPWDTEAIALLPNHLHMLWRMPEGDTDYSTRIAVLKKRFTRAYLAAGRVEAEVPHGQQQHRLRGVWQRRFWEHTIRDARDLAMHVEYIHMNPVKHGLVSRPVDWPWSSFHRYVEEGKCDLD